MAYIPDGPPEPIPGKKQTVLREGATLTEEELQGMLGHATIRMICSHAEAIDQIVDTDDTNRRCDLFDRYTSLTHQSDKEAFVAALIGKVIMQSKQLQAAKRRER